MKQNIFLLFFVLFGSVRILSSQVSETEKSGLSAPGSYEATWSSLTKHPYPEWFQDAKFGIYFHWGVYSVPAFGSEWYPRWMYIDTLVWGAQYHKHHLETYGTTDKFGYKDFIPMFKAEKFNADEWAELFSRSGAKFAGPVAEHCDGFSMWDSRLNPWNAKKMGPKRDIVGELETAVRKKGMNFIVTLHHSWEWGWYPTWDTLTDCSDPEYSGLYGQKTLPGAFDYKNPDPAPGIEWLQMWKNKTIEVIDKYQPDMVWLDSRLSFIPDSIKKNLIAYYYNKGLEWNREVSMTYKVGELPANSAILDIEKGALDNIEKFPWLTDASVDDASWCYNNNPKYKSAQKLVNYLITIVSKNGQLLLDIPPKPDGTIPDEVKTILLEMGGWLSVNGEAIYGTRPWIRFGEGPTSDGKGDFNDKIPDFTSNDIRFTTKGDTLYALVMAIPASGKILITSLPVERFRIDAIETVGTNKKLKFSQNSDGALVVLPKMTPSEFAFALRIPGLKAVSANGKGQPGPANP
jgi:alpha-L-fucosidase